MEEGDAPVLRADSDRESVFILLGTYLGLVDELKRRHRDGMVFERTRDGEILFRAVVVPPLASDAPPA